MVENQHQKITGYRDLMQADIDLMNEVKDLEKTFAELAERVKRHVSRDDMRKQPQAARDVALARTHIEDGCIRLVRAVARPVSPWETL